MNKSQKKQLNKLAGLFYKLQGYEVNADYDFSEAHHPQEISCWNMALIAHDVLKGTFLYEKNLVDPRERIMERFGG
jgi:hypothetical protein